MGNLLAHRLAYPLAHRPDGARRVLTDFQQEKAITHDLDHYKDLMHHSQAINDQLLEAILQGKNRQTPEQVIRSNEALFQQVRDLAVAEQ